MNSTSLPPSNTPCDPKGRLRAVLCALLAACSMIFAGSALAVPAAPIVHTLSQPDGMTFEARQWGDEWLHGWETLDGYTIVLDPVGKVWRYAERRVDGSLGPSASVVRRDAPPAGSAPHLRPLGAALTLLHSMRASAQAAAGVKAVLPTGTENVPVILVNFADTTPTYTPGDFASLLFGDGTWSMSDYFSEVSYGRFTVAPGPGGVAGWFNASKGHDYYGLDSGANSKDVNVAELVVEALTAADAAGFNFGPYDRDGDCVVDVVDIVHQGPGQELSANPLDIWSKRWSLVSSLGARYRTNTVCSANPLNYVWADQFVIEPEREGTGIATVGVFAHEFGHALGLPDLYDTDESSAGIGDWSLMAAGEWCFVTRPGDRPSHLDAWSKAKLGWMTPQQVTGTPAAKAIGQAETSADVFQLLPGTPGQSGEYFLIENRQKTGFDAGLPGSGLLIWHVDESRTDNDHECFPGGPACSSQHYRVALEQADGLWDLERNNNRGDAGDPFPGSSAATTFSDGTSPSSALYGGQASGVKISAISASGATMTADLAMEPVGTNEVTVFSDDFEGAFPGSWQVASATNTGWGRVSCTAASGNGSAWCAGGGSAPQPPCTQYLGGMQTWMVYGPFSLADATDAWAEFDAWYDTETYHAGPPPAGDRFWWLISVDGTNYSGYPVSGSSGGWVHKVFNFKDVTSVTAAGNATVWLAFGFESDQAVQSGGAYVDNVVVKKTVAAICSYAVSPTSQSFSSAGGTGTVTVTAPAGCPWTAASDSAWITITSGASGSGDGPVGYSVAVNTGVARSGTLTVAGQTVTVSQDVAGCAYLISPTSQSFAVTGGSGTVTVTVTAGIDCAWTAVSNAAWITVTSGATGTGNGSVGYEVSANLNAARSGTVTVAGQTFTVRQDAFVCSYSISPSSATITAAGGTGEVAVSTTSNCSWTAVSNAAWITITGGASGTGTGSMSYSVAANTGGRLTGTVTIGGQTFTVNQEAAACSLSISPTEKWFSSVGGAAAVSVVMTTGGDCPWSATSKATWITITSGASGNGNGTVGYSVAANTGASRTGAMTIAAQTFTVTQDAAGCSYAISPASATFDARASSGTITIAAPALCRWSAMSDSSWLAVLDSSGAGNGHVDYTVEENTGAARTGRITVEGATFTVTQAGPAGPTTHSQWLGAVSHVDGAGGSHWRSDVAVLNGSSQPVAVEYVLYSPSGTLTRQVVVAANGQDLRKDIAAWLGYTSGSGALEVRSDQDVFVMGRTYNQVDATHTYGQNYDGQEPGLGLLAAGQSAWLPLLTQTPDFRCNVAITNSGASAASVTLSLYDGQGNLVWSGSDESGSIGPGGFIQYLKPFQNHGGRNDIENGYAKVTVNSGSGVMAWASVIDERTGDPTTIFMKR